MCLCGSISRSSRSDTGIKTGTYKTHGEEGVAKLAAGVPLGLGETRDVGLACAYLCGEGGNYLTGICLDVNGGMYMH